MLYYIIAGEVSGDLHGANLMQAIRAQDEAAGFRFWGGDRMRAVGGEMVKDYRETAFMGFVEVIKNLRTIFRLLRHCKNDLAQCQPDALILIDYPGFNMRIAQWAREHLPQTRIYYYISPQVWAWKARRALKLKRTVDRMFVILPFERAFYQRYDFDVTYVGHPLLDELALSPPDPTFRSQHSLDNREVIALLPGSRKQEIAKLLPTMCAVAQSMPQHQFIIAAVPTVPPSYYHQRIPRKATNVRLIVDQVRDLLHEATAALVASGTATLETALLDVPQVVCYRGSRINYLIAKRLIDIKYISLVNLIADKPVVEELIQDDFNFDRVKASLAEILEAQQAAQMRKLYAEIREQLGGAGASERTARLIVDDLSSHRSAPTH